MPGLAHVGVPNVPSSESFDRYEFDRWVRNEVLSLQAALLPPTTVTNLRATALGGGVQIDFTRSDGDAYVLYWNSTPSINMATRVDLGVANVYVDNIGADAVTRYYAVKAKKGNVSGDVSPWVSATTLAVGTAITAPDPPPGSETPFTDTETDSIAIQVPDQETYTQV